MISLTNNKDLKPEDFPSDIKGLRMTKQRREVLAVILRDRDHPTAIVPISMIIATFRMKHLARFTTSFLKRESN